MNENLTRMKIAELYSENSKYIDYIHDILNQYKEFKNLQHNYTEFNLRSIEKDNSIVIEIDSVEFDLDNKSFLIKDIAALSKAIDKQSKKTVIKMIKEAEGAGLF